MRCMQELITMNILTTNVSRLQASHNLPRLLNPHSLLSKLTHSNAFLPFTAEVCGWSMTSFFYFRNSPGKRQSFPCSLGLILLGTLKLSMTTVDF